MEEIQFKVLIDADRQKVWNIMLGKDTYTEWTKPFHEGSYFEGDWSEGSEMRFLGPTPNGTLEGMYSKIRKNVPYEFISIEHLGIVSGGVVDTTSEKVKTWAHSFENYTFTDKDGQTEVTIEMQTPSEYKEMFNQMWPKALNALKALSEATKQASF